MADNKVPLTIVYRSPQTQPPLFVAGSFSHPQWVPQEMEYTTGEDGAITFSKAFDVEPSSKIQYKFRVGPGDWWVLDEDAPIVTDDAGNRNNFIEAPSAVETKSEEPIQPAKNDHEVLGTNLIQHPQPISRLEALKEAEKVDRSGTSTPEYARTAAEVAESAALVDPPTPEPETIDVTASSPPDEVANTAAEVADTAKDLDNHLAEEHTETVTPAHKTIADVKEDIENENLDTAEFSNEPEHAPPLFAHECAGLYEEDEIPGVPDDEDRAEIANGNARDRAEEDFQDPTLEQFPSSRTEIMAAVRKVETGLNANQTLNEGVPPSPVFRSRHSSTGDGLGEHQSPEASPVSSKGSQHLSLPVPQPQENKSERSLSVISLGSIAEDDEPEASTVGGIAPIVEQAETADEAIKVAKNAEGDVALDLAKPSSRPVVTIPSPSATSNNDLISPISDEDEAVVMRNGKGKEKSVENGQSGCLTPERAATPKLPEPSSPSEPAPNTAIPVEDPAPATEPEPTMPVPPSPEIVVSKAEEIEPQEELGEAPASNENGHKDIEAPSANAGQNENGHKDVEAPSANAGQNENGHKDVEAPSDADQSENGSQGEPEATSSAIEDGQPSSMKKRSAHQSSPRDRSGTPASMPENDWEAAKNGNWFSAFFRLIFVDWVGGFVSRLCGGKRKTT
ncbi:hypothetical protein Daus18300_001210 [Diaporthe australafricana]|uniref:AMP-activated protein kinase glycogen-binding domain-containing protein n=1 Tax=Diaporthe australafricana TaxID=127596 RepID=A0ABR3XX82_9PEZI